MVKQLYSNKDVIYIYVYIYIKGKIMVNMYRRIELTFLNVSKSLFLFLHKYISLLDLGSHQYLENTEDWLFCYILLLG